MIVLHGLYIPNTKQRHSGNFFVWGESSKRRRKGNNVHPFCATAREVIGEMSVTTGRQVDMIAKRGSCFLDLPTIDGSPLPSPHLVVEKTIEKSDTEPVLSPWEVKGIALSPTDAVSILCSASSQNIPQLGDSLRFWITVSRYAIELLAGQQFMPSVRECDDKIYARWTPLFAEPERMALLMKSMPPLCQSYVGDGIPAGRDIIQEFVTSVVDQSIRRWVRKSRPELEHSSIWDEWLGALQSGNANVKGSPRNLKILKEEIDSWTRDVYVPVAEGFRTCFQLHTPRKRGRKWEVSFLLQAVDDMSLLIPAERIWTESKRTLNVLKRKFDNPQERLLADLGRASRVFPKIDESLAFPRPESCELNTQEAYVFLRETASLLEQSGFAVFVPPWWKKTNTRIGLKLQMKPKALSNESRGLFGFDSIIEYNWRVALGNEELTAEEFERIASLKVPLVQLKGKWVELRHDDIEEATQLFKAGRNRSEMNLSEALRLGLTGKGTVAGLAVQEVETKGWLARMLKELSAGEKLASLPQPAKFRGELREYQVRGYSWLHFLRRWGIGACLADDMGLGKTIQFIALLLKERDKPVLLICPMSVVGNWEREVTRFGPSISVLVHHGSERLTGKKFVREAKKHHLTITTYSLSARDEKHLAQVNWKGICLDEAQNIKNPSTKQAQAIRRLQSGYRVTLTGTPIENRLSELWSIMQFLNPGFLGSLKDFRTRFIIPIERYQDKEAALRLKKIMQPFMLRRLKSDKSIIRDLPEKIEMKEFCNLTQEQATLYEAVVQEMSDPIEDSEGIERKGLILATLMKLKQVCNHPAHFLGDRSAIRDRSGKVNRLMQLLEVVLAENDKALIFTQFRQMGDLLKEHLQEAFNRETLFLHGGTPKKKRDQMIEQFQESSDGPPLFILSLKAGGLGLNLTQAHHVFHFDRWWNPAVENQATDRVFRIGQKKNVQVHKFVCTGTIEERIDELMTQKQELAETIIGSGEQWLTEMSTDELKKMFALNRDTVV